MVLVKLHGVLREESNVKEVDAHGSSIREVLEGLPENVKAVLRKYSEYVVVLLNGRRVYDLANTKVGSGDIVDVTLPVGGG